jgi:hypothetical protein
MRNKIKAWVFRAKFWLKQDLCKWEPLVKINHIVFWWYYKRVPVFFRQWTLLRSISLLSSNYSHLSKQFEINEVFCGELIRRNTMLVDKIQMEKLKSMGIDRILATTLGNSLGVKIPSDADN